MKRAFQTLCLLTLASVFAVAALEFGLRIVRPQFDPTGAPYFVLGPDNVPLGPSDSEFRMVKKAGDFDVPLRFNSHGLRDAKDVSSGRLEDLYVVGDSFGFGWGVEESERFSNLLAELVGRDVYNLSIPTDLQGYVRLLDYAQRLGAKVRHVVVGVCMENDLVDYESLQETSPTRYGDHGRVRRIKAFFTHKSAIYLALTTVFHANPRLREFAIGVGLVTDNLAGMRKNVYRERVIVSSADRLLEVTRPFDAIAVIIPSRGLWVGDNIEAETQVHTAFVSALRDRGIRVLDMRDVFEAGGDPMAFHFENDGHWNVRGHREAGEAIAAELGAPAGL